MLVWDLKKGLDDIREGDYLFWSLVQE